MPRPLDQSVNGSGILDRPLAAFAKASAGPIPLPRRSPGVDGSRTIRVAGMEGSQTTAENQNSSGQGSTIFQSSSPFLIFFISVVSPPFLRIQSFTVFG